MADPISHLSERGQEAAEEEIRSRCVARKVGAAEECVRRAFERFKESLEEEFRIIDREAEAELRELRGGHREGKEEGRQPAAEDGGGVLSDDDKAWILDNDTDESEDDAVAANARRLFGRSGKPRAAKRPKRPRRRRKRKIVLDSLSDDDATGVRDRAHGIRFPPPPSPSPDAVPAAFKKEEGEEEEKKERSPAQKSQPARGRWRRGAREHPRRGTRTYVHTYAVRKTFWNMAGPLDGPEYRLNK
ncbi:hypothetical protein SAMD00023353_1201410 [Rosellinia necatrix]|uniref:Uncharacterized protein n=1 Tax=Rosellinia necatrix TaxID=77044 RepID=A0A1W2TKC9_ROSNE|nr:hypothetical protein SAMD00023353_1201410 [Rosellinia necatrix]